MDLPAQPPPLLFAGEHQPLPGGLGLLGQPQRGERGGGLVGEEGEQPAVAFRRGAGAVAGDFEPSDGAAVVAQQEVWTRPVSGAPASASCRGPARVSTLTAAPETPRSSTALRQICWGTSPGCGACWSRTARALTASCGRARGP